MVQRLTARFQIRRILHRVHHGFTFHAMRLRAPALRFGFPAHYAIVEQGEVLPRCLAFCRQMFHLRHPALLKFQVLMLHQKPELARRFLAGDR